MKKKIIWITLILIILLSSPVLALPQPSYDFYVFDEAGIMDEFTEEYIIKTNLELYEKTGAQIVVASVNDLEGMDINTYATSLFENWEIGSKQYDNGLLMLIAPNDRELWIEVGYGLEGALPDSRVNRLIDENILPSFSAGNYNDGLILGFESILTFVEAEYNIQLQTREEFEGNYQFADTTNAVSGVPNIFMIIGLIVFLFIDFKFFRGWLTFSLLRGLGRGGGGSGRGGSSGGGGRSGGGGAGGSW